MHPLFCIFLKIERSILAKMIFLFSNIYDKMVLQVEGIDFVITK